MSYILATPWHVLSAALVLFAGAAIVLRLSKSFHCPWRRSLAIYCWHTAFCILYLTFSLSETADAIRYFNDSMSGSVSFGLGTRFVVWFTSIFSHFLGFSYLGVFLVYNIIGTIGLIALYGALREGTRDKGRLLRGFAFLLIFFPSISFWSSAIGKDAIAITATCFFLWGCLDVRHRKGSLLAAVAMMLLVRPHMAALLVAAGAASIAIGSRMPILQRLVVGLFSLMLMLVIVPFGLDYAGLGEASGVADVTEYIEYRQDASMLGGSGLDISGLSPPAQLGTYLFRPFPFEAQGLTQLAASVENVALLLLFLFGAFWLWRRRKPQGDRVNRLALWIYSLGAWGILGITTANLGIATRQKWMFVPVLVYLFISSMGRIRRHAKTSVPSSMAFHPERGP